MLARKCDRCGVLYDCYGGDTATDSIEKTNGIAICYFSSQATYSVKKCYDLCPVCMKEIFDWLDKRNKQ